MLHGGRHTGVLWLDRWDLTRSMPNTPSSWAVPLGMVSRGLCRSSSALELPCWRCLALWWEAALVSVHLAFALPALRAAPRSAEECSGQSWGWLLGCSSEAQHR